MYRFVLIKIRVEGCMSKGEATQSFRVCTLVKWGQFLKVRICTFVTLMIETPGDLVRGQPCVQQASCLEGGPLLWIWPLYLLVN